MHARARLAACAGAAALTGCTVGPNYQPPQTAVPAQWAGMDGSSSGGEGVTSVPTAAPADAAAWWTTFNDPVLTALIDRAVAGNLTVAQAESRIRQARAARTVTAAGLYPALDASASVTRSRSGSGGDENGPSFSSSGNLFRAGFDASWEIDVFGGIRRDVEASDAAILAAVYDRSDLLVSLLGEVATAYLDLRGAQEQLRIARENLETQQQTLGLTQERFDAGFVSGLDVANSTAQVTQTASQIPSFEAQVRAGIYALSVLIGREPGNLLDELLPDADPPSPPARVPIGLPSDLLLRRPDVQRAEANLHETTARIGVAVAQQYPRFTLTGQFGTAGRESESLVTIANRFWSIGPAVSLPLFSGGRIQGNIELAKAQAEEALIAYRATVLTALQDVETSLSAFTHEQRRRESLTAAVEASRQAVDLSLQLYSAGNTDFLNVLSAQRQLYATEAALSQSRTNVGVNLVSLYKALGGGWAKELSLAPDSGVRVTPAPDSGEEPNQ